MKSHEERILKLQRRVQELPACPEATLIQDQVAALLVNWKTLLDK